MKFLVAALFTIWWWPLRYAVMAVLQGADNGLGWRQRVAAWSGAIAAGGLLGACSQRPLVLVAVAASSCSLMVVFATLGVAVPRRLLTALASALVLGWGLSIAVVLNDYQVDPGVFLVSIVLAVLVIPPSVLAGFLGERTVTDVSTTSRDAVVLRVLSLLSVSLWFVARDYSMLGCLTVAAILAFYFVASRTSTPLRSVLHSAAPLLIVLGVVMGGPVASAVSGETAVPLAKSADSPEWKKQLLECVNMPGYQVLPQRDCYIKYFTGRAETVGVDNALDELVALHQDDLLGPAFVSQCHEVLHGIAYNMAHEIGVENMLGSYRVTCTGGFAHGILVTYVEKYGWPSIRDSLPTYCQTLTTKIVDAMVAKGKPKPTDTGWISWNCNHMLGHVIYENTRDDLVKGGLMCTTWPDGSPERDGCGAGFYMEHFLDISRSLHGWKPPETKDEVFKACKEADKEMIEHCFNEAGMPAAYFTKFNYADTFRLCYDEAGPEYRHACYQSIARILVVTNKFSATASRDTCLLGTAVEVDAADACLAEVAQAMLSETYAPEAAKMLCDAVVQPAMIESCKSRTAKLWKQLSGSNAGGGTGAV